jgi:light-regulated signal transduction histidine kinase (bacteriophytochrome)
MDCKKIVENHHGEITVKSKAKQNSISFYQLITKILKINVSTLITDDD